MTSSPTFPVLNESRVRKLATASAIKKGMAAWQSGRIANPMLAEAERTLFANVQDEAHRVFHVAVRHIAGEEFDVRCDCGEKDVCTHAAALLLNWALDRHMFTRAESMQAEPIPVDSAQQLWRGYLQHLNMTQLRAIARRLQIRPHGPDRDSLEVPLVALLSQPQTVQQALTQITEYQRQVLQMLFLLSDGEPDTLPNEIQKALGWQGRSDVENMLRELSEWGLAVSLPSAWHASDPYSVAPGVAPTIPPLGVSPPDESAPEPLRGIDLMLYDGSDAKVVAGEAQRRLWEVLWLAARLPLRARATPPEPAQARGIKGLRQWPYIVDELVRMQVRPGWMHQLDSVLTVPAPAPRLDERSLATMFGLTGDDDLSDFASYLLASMKESASQPGSNGIDSGHEASDSTLPTPANVFSAWQQLNTWTELWLAQRHSGLQVRRSVVAAMRQGYNGFLQQLARGRRFITRLLALLPPREWLELEPVLELVYVTHPDFLRDHAPFAPPVESWWLEWQGRKVNFESYEAWRASYGQVIEEILCGPLRWLGAAEVAEDPGSGKTQRKSVRAFRITSLGAALLRGQEPPPAESLPLILPGDLSARLPMCRGDLTDYVEMDRIACFEHVRDNAAVYAFEIHSAHRAFEAGLTDSDVLATVERLAGQPVPASVANQWRTWWGQYARTRLYNNLTVIEFADDYILQELLSQSDLQEHLLFTFGPRLVAVRPESADAIARQLVKKGYTPMLA